MAIDNRGAVEKPSIRPLPGAIIVVVAVLFLVAAVAYLCRAVRTCSSLVCGVR